MYRLHTVLSGGLLHIFDHLSDPDHQKALGIGLPHHTCILLHSLERVLRDDIGANGGQIFVVFGGLMVRVEDFAAVEGF